MTCSHTSAKLKWRAKSEAKPAPQLVTCATALNAACCSQNFLSSSFLTTTWGKKLNLSCFSSQTGSCMEYKHILARASFPSQVFGAASCYADFVTEDNSLKLEVSNDTSAVLYWFVQCIFSRQPLHFLQIDSHISARTVTLRSLHKCQLAPCWKQVPWSTSLSGDSL